MKSLVSKKQNKNKSKIRSPKIRSSEKCPLEKYNGKFRRVIT